MNKQNKQSRFQNVLISRILCSVWKRIILKIPSMKGNRQHWFEQKGHRYQCHAYLSMEMEGYRSSCEVNLIEFRTQLLIFIFLKRMKLPYYSGCIKRRSAVGLWDDPSAGKTMLSFRLNSQNEVNGKSVHTEVPCRDRVRSLPLRRESCRIIRDKEFKEFKEL